MHLRYPFTLISSIAWIASITFVNPASASVVYLLSGTVIVSDPGALPSVGDSVTGFVELTDQAVAAPTGDEFALGDGDVLDIRIYFGPYTWDITRSSVTWVQFEGYVSHDKNGFAGYSVKLFENFFGTVSGAYCTTSAVCSVEGGGNGVLTMYDGRGFSTAATVWTRQQQVPEPSTSTLVLLGLCSAALATSRRQRHAHSCRATLQCTHGTLT